MSIKKLITTIGVFIIFASLGIGTYFVYQKGLLTFKPDPDIKPTKIRITNVSHDRFTISWVTAKPTNGSIMYGDNTKLEQLQLDDSDQLTGQSQARKLHHVTISNLKPATQYYFKIRSGEKNTQFDDSGKPYSVKTAPALGSQPPTDMINGVVHLTTGKPAEGAIVYVSIPGVAPLSTQVKKDGSWLINLSSARNTTLTEYATYDPQTVAINIDVQGDSKTSKIVTNAANKSPVPVVTLGETYDFTQETVASVPEKPLVEQDQSQQLPLEPEESTKSSDPSESTESAKTPEVYDQSIESEEVTILNPAEDGEELFTTQPEFLGTGPAKKVLTVSIAGGVSPISTTKTVDDEGNWSFSPSDPLDPGDYTLTVDYIDSMARSQTLSRDFIIASDATGGLEDLPAFEATPTAHTSPSPIPTISPTPKPTATASLSARTSMPSTKSGVPVSGVNTPTVVLLLFGFGLIASGYSWKRSAS
ncbi:MAG: fibronectin type III domain-containing protein [Patescibacteria group bacterium]|jgi:hypothetical protein